MISPCGHDRCVHKGHHSCLPTLRPDGSGMTLTEKQTTTWDKTIIDRSSDLKNWVEVLKSLVSNTKVLKIFAFSNNHYALCRCRYKA